MPLTALALDELRALLGEDGVVADASSLFTYDADAMTLARFAPDVVVLPRSSDEVAAVLLWARAHGLPVNSRRRACTSRPIRRRSR